MRTVKNKLSPKSHILELPIYEGGANGLGKDIPIIKLSSNENPAGPSVKAIEAFKQASTELAKYPDSSQSELREAIASVHRLDRSRILCGAGSDEIIQFICNCFAGLGDEVIHTEHGFAMYRIAALAAGATPVSVREKDRVVDVGRILSGCTKRTKIVFIANPNNPTGTMIELKEVKKLASSLPRGVLLVLDGAYAEYVEKFDAGLELVENNSNVIMIRTFSKIYGLGALRVGWCYGPKYIVDSINKLRGPFNVSTPAIKAAVAAIKDIDYVDRCREKNIYWRNWLASELDKLEIKSDTAYGNFVLGRFENAELACSANDFLKSAGLLVRQVENYGLPSALRITVGLEKECEKVINTLKLFKEKN